MDLITIQTTADGADELRAALTEFPSIQSHFGEIQAQGGGESLWTIALKILEPLPAKLWEVVRRLAKHGKIGLIKVREGDRELEFRDITPEQLDRTVAAILRLKLAKDG
jgi:hypothetical protein